LIGNPHCSSATAPGTVSDGARFHIDRTMIDGFVVRDLERHGLPDAGRR